MNKHEIIYNECFLPSVVLMFSSLCWLPKNHIEPVFILAFVAFCLCGYDSVRFAPLMKISVWGFIISFQAFLTEWHCADNLRLGDSFFTVRGMCQVGFSLLYVYFIFPFNRILCFFFHNSANWFNSSLEYLNPRTQQVVTQPSWKQCTEVWLFDTLES